MTAANIDNRFKLIKCTNTIIIIKFARNQRRFTFTDFLAISTVIQHSYVDLIFISR